MLSIARLKPAAAGGWEVHVDWGRSTEVWGPYRWKWVARLVAWMEDGQH